MLITIVDVSPLTSYTSAAGKSYKAIELAFKNEDGKINSRKIMEFDKVIRPVVQTLQKGDLAEVVTVKEGEYWVWKSIAKLDGDAAQASSAPTASTKSTPARTTSTYETPEERAKRQVYIIRQSSISSAIGLLTVGSKSTPAVADVLDVAKQFEKFVFGVEEVDDDVNFDDDFPDDIPL